jgi:hypothetical protein
MIETRIVPTRRLNTMPSGKEAGVLLIRHLMNGKIERVHPNAMHGLFIIAPDFAAHPEPTLWDAHHHGFNGPNPGCWRKCHGISIQTRTRKWPSAFTKVVIRRRKKREAPI